MFDEALEAQVEAMRLDAERKMREMPRNEAMERARELAALAAESDSPKCFIGGERVFHLPYSHALVPGHIYSDAGKREFVISQCCEYHFDEAFPDEDDEPGRPVSFGKVVKDVVTDL